MGILPRTGFVCFPVRGFAAIRLAFSVDLGLNQSLAGNRANI